MPDKNIIVDPDEMALLASKLHEAAGHFGTIKEKIDGIKSIMDEMYEGQVDGDCATLLEEMAKHYDIIKESHLQLEQFVLDTCFGVGAVDVDRAQQIRGVEEDG